jgi:Rv2258c-like winged HTH domain
MAVTPTIDEAKLEAFMERFVGELGACATAPMVLIGDRLGLDKAMADSEPVTPAQLAQRTGTNERYIREWLCQQAASEYLEYDAADGTFRLPPEQTLALAVDESPAFIEERLREGIHVADQGITATQSGALTLHPQSGTSYGSTSVAPLSRSQRRGVR